MYAKLCGWLLIDYALEGHVAEVELYGSTRALQAERQLTKTVRMVASMHANASRASAIFWSSPLPLSTGAATGAVAAAEEKPCNIMPAAGAGARGLPNAGKAAALVAGMHRGAAANAALEGATAAPPPNPNPPPLAAAAGAPAQPP